MSFFVRVRQTPYGTGALEGFLLDGLACQDKVGRDLVDSAHAFVATQPDKPYLAKRRLRPKATLGSVLSVISPDDVFRERNERLVLVGWELVTEVLQSYRLLADLD
jgi:hypothetical protein